METSSMETTNNTTKSSSIIFRYNRALGFVSNHIPAVTRYIHRRKDTLITTCVGRSFQVYTANHFRLLHVSGIHPAEITALCTDRRYIYTASDRRIFAWRAGKHIRHVYQGHARNVHLLLPFGSHLVAVDEANVLNVWDIAKEKVYLEIPFKENEFCITAVAHPPTYLNKIVLGSQQGQLKIWNIKENRHIYTFAGHRSRVTCLQPTPALDVIAVGYQDGNIIVLNLKFDEVLMSYALDWGAVSTISFRTDGPPIMATGCSNGNIVFWNLEEYKISSQLQAHDDAVTTAMCFANEPLLLTTSPDNTMKLWIFDMPDGGARLLRIREGHSAPPLYIRYHGSSGTSILSSGEDSSLRVFSTISETLNKSMGKASYNRKASKKKNRFEEDGLTMPPITQFTSEVTREKEWDNIAAIHTGIIQTTTWSFHQNRMGSHRMVPEKFQNKHRTDFQTETTCITLTHCGNFVVIGYSSGDLVRFNIQSGIQRANYGNPAHAAAIRGVTCDNLNQFVVSGCSGGNVKFWPFKANDSSKPNAIIKFNDGVTLMRSHRESALIAIALNSFVVCIIDSDTKVIVRKFAGHTAKINDVTFSADSRWLITAAMDATIKVWDIPSSYMIDHFKVERPCVSLCMSPTGDFLATTHVNNLGICLWANKMLFSQISLHSIDPYSEAPSICLFTNDADNEYTEEAVPAICNTDDSSSDNEEIHFKYESPAQLSAQLVTLSGLAATQWQTLFDLAAIKRRNKPKIALKVPKQAPFFLPTVAGIEMKFDLGTTAAGADSTNSRIAKTNPLANKTTLGALLESSAANCDYQACIDYLKKLGPSMTDFEIKSLHPLGGGSQLLMLQFLKTIEHMFTTNVDFELAQSYLSVFLRTHGLDLVEFPGIIEFIKSVAQAQEICWSRIEQKLTFSMSVVSALRNFVHKQ